MGWAFGTQTDGSKGALILTPCESKIKYQEDFLPCLMFGWLAHRMEGETGMFWLGGSWWLWGWSLSKDTVAAMGESSDVRAALGSPPGLGQHLQRFTYCASDIKLFWL